MKRILLVVFLFTMVTTGYSQATTGFNYQAVIRDANGAAMSSKIVQFHISLTNSDGTITYYSENQETTTTSLGVVNIVIGE